MCEILWRNTMCCNKPKPNDQQDLHPVCLATSFLHGIAAQQRGMNNNASAPSYWNRKLSFSKQQTKKLAAKQFGCKTCRLFSLGILATDGVLSQTAEMCANELFSSALISLSFSLIKLNTHLLTSRWKTENISLLPCGGLRSVRTHLSK